MLNLEMELCNEAYPVGFFDFNATVSAESESEVETMLENSVESISKKESSFWSFGQGYSRSMGSLPSEYICDLSAALARCVTPSSACSDSRGVEGDGSEEANREVTPTIQKKTIDFSMVVGNVDRGRSGAGCWNLARSTGFGWIGCLVAVSACL